MPGPEGPLDPSAVDKPLPYKVYFEQLKSLVKSYSVQEVNRVKSVEEDDNLPAKVYLKVLKRGCLEPRWTGPHKVAERTSHAVKLKGQKNWYHITQTT